MTTIVVTGGAGFIGSNFTRRALAETAARVVVFDKLTYAGSLDNLRDLESHPRYAFVRGDIAARDDVVRMYRQWSPDAVVNFAAESHVDRSIDSPETFLETNVRGAFELLEGARRQLRGADDATRSAFRLLHVSTDEVFGSAAGDSRFVETTRYAPNSPYAASKAAADHLARAYHRTYGLGVLITNCSNNYGPYQFPEKLIPLMILNAIEGKPLPIYGDGGNVRDWLHVDDHCAGLLLVLRRGLPGETYNLGGDAERTNVEIVDRLCALLDEELPSAANPALAGRAMRQYADLKTFVADRPGHDRRYAIDASKIERELGWRPVYGFDSGLRHTVRWYLANRDWCARVQGSGERERLGLGAPA